MAEGKSRRTPRRLQLACEPCKIGKLKCDRTLPVCEQCYKRSRESACKYTEKGLRYNASAQTAGSIKEKVARLESLVNSLKDRQPPDEQVLPPDASAALDSWPGEGETTSQMGKLRFAKSGSTQWIGPSNWESVIEDIADVKAFLEREDDWESAEMDASRTSSSDTIPVANIFLATSQTLGQTQLLERMPPRSEMDRSIAAWFNVMDPTRVIVHAPTFQQQYERFWSDPRAVEPAWLALLLTTGSLGAEISGQALNDAPTLIRADLLRKLASHALVLSDPCKPQPWLVECLILFVKSLLFHQHDGNSHTWQLMGLALRLCHQAGYHRDPSYNSNFSRFECEMRRRVWMVACELDIGLSNTVGMVSSVNYKLCDTLPPSNLTEADFSPEHCTEPRPYDDCTLVQVQICFSRLVRVLGDIVISSHAVANPSRVEIDAMSRQLEDARSQLPEKLKMKPLDLSFIDSPTEIIDRLRLELAYQKARTILYRRFLDEPNFEQERHQCMSAAQTTVQLCVDMLIAAEPGCQLSSLRLLLVRHVHDFSLAAMLICSQLDRLVGADTRPTSIGLAEDIREKLMRCCQLWNPPNIQSPRGRMALSAVISYLQGDGQTKQSTFSPGQPITGTPHSITHMINIGPSPCIDTGPLHSLHSAFPDTQAGDTEVMFDPIFDPQYNVFGDMQEGWAWSTSEQHISPSATSVGLLDHGIATRM